MKQTVTVQVEWPDDEPFPPHFLILTLGCPEDGCLCEMWRQCGRKSRTGTCDYGPMYTEMLARVKRGELKAGWYERTWRQAA